MSKFKVLNYIDNQPVLGSGTVYETIAEALTAATSWNAGERAFFSTVVAIQNCDTGNIVHKVSVKQDVEVRESKFEKLIKRGLGITSADLRLNGGYDKLR